MTDDTTGDAEPKPPHLIGYARVSMADQNPDLQIDALVAAGVDRRDIYYEQSSGANSDRPELAALMRDVRPGDVVVVWKVDRLSRNTLKRAVIGVWHWFSIKHTDRYLSEVSFRWNRRKQGTDARLAGLFAGNAGRLRWKELVA